MPIEQKPELKSHIEMFLESLDVLDGDKDVVKRFGPPLVYGASVVYAVLLMSGVELHNVVHALAGICAMAGGWFARHKVG